MKKDKEYITPKCVDLSSNSVAWAQAPCSPGSSPSDMQCWNGGSPTGPEGECADGTTPETTEGGICTDGTTPNTQGPGWCNTGGNPQSGGDCVGGTTPE